MRTHEQGSAGWIRTRNKIVTLNDGLARRAAARYTGTNYPKDSLLQLARLGLLNAVQKYDPESGNSFSSLAVPFCRGAIQHHLRDYETPIKYRVGRETSDRIRAIQAQLEKELGQKIPAEKIALYREGLKPEIWDELNMLTASKHFKSLDEPTSEGDTIPLAAALPESLEEREQQELQQRAVMAAMAGLSELQQMILISHYWQGMSANAIAKQHGITEVEASTILSDCLHCLRETL